MSLNVFYHLEYLHDTLNSKQFSFPLKTSNPSDWLSAYVLCGTDFKK